MNNQGIETPLQYRPPGSGKLVGNLCVVIFRLLPLLGARSRTRLLALWGLLSWRWRIITVITSTLERGNPSTCIVLFRLREKLVILLADAKLVFISTTTTLHHVVFVARWGGVDESNLLGMT